MRVVRLTAVVGLMVWSVAGVGATPVPTAAAADATMTGTVTAAAGGAALPGIKVQLWNGESGTEHLIAEATTDGAGHYTLTAPSLCGDLLVLDPSGTYAYDRSYPCDDAVTDVQLVPGGRLTSTITDSVTGDPIAGVCVSLREVLVYWTISSLGCSDGAGHWASPGLPVAFYNVTFTMPAQSPYSSTSRRLVPVPSGTTPLNLAFAPGGRVSGTVTADDTGLPLAGVTVDLVALDGLTDVATATTDVNGHYVTTGVPDGDWLVRFTPADPFYAGLFFANGGMDPVSIVGHADVPNVDQSLTRYPAITGTVTDDLGAPIAGVCAEYYGEGDDCLDFTDGAGHYSIPAYYEGPIDLAFYEQHHGLVQATVEAGPDGGTMNVVMNRLHAITGHVTAAVGGAPVAGGYVQATGVADEFGGYANVAPDGSYSMEVAVGDFVLKYTGPGDSSLADEYYDGASSADTATVVHAVGPGATSSNVDFTLDVGGTLSGTVTDTAGDPLAGATVSTGYRSATTALDGTYTIHGLQTGDVRVEFQGPDVEPRYIRETFDDNNDTLVGVVLGQPTNGIDASLDRYGLIRGTVTDLATGVPLPSDVRALDGTGGALFLLDGYGGSGPYGLEVPPGTYTVRADPSDYGRLPGYWDGATTFGDAQTITVDAGQIVDHVDFALGEPTSPTFVALPAPQRLFDSRHAANAGQLGLLEQASGSIGHDLDARFVQNVPQRFVVTGVGGVPADPGGMALNVVAVNPALKGYLTMYPCATVGSPVPATSTLNFAAGVTQANSAVVDPDASGGLCIVASQTIDVVLDVTGYFWPGFTPLAAPQRLVDTRAGQLGVLEQPDGWWGSDFDTHLVAGEPQYFRMSGAAGVPLNAAAMALNVAAVIPSAKGYLTMYPCYGNDLGEVPDTSSLNFTAGVNVANSMVLSPSVWGGICVVASVATDVIVDVTGYFEYGYEAEYQPVRLLDTRPSHLGEWEQDYGTLGADVATPFAPSVVQRYVFDMTAAQTGVALNITAVNPAARGYVTVFPCASVATPVPATSSLNFMAGTNVANGMIVQPDATGGVCIVASQTTHLIIDMTGSFA